MRGGSHMNRHSFSFVATGRLVACLGVLAALSACGGSDTKKFSIGGNATGLTGTVVLQNNGGENLSLSANGAFTFASRVKSGKAYAVTVLTQPAGQTCVVTNGSGTASADVSNVTVTCTANVTYTVGGTVSGLAAGTTVVLQNNGASNLSVNANGAFTFANPVAA